MGLNVTMVPMNIPILMRPLALGKMIVITELICLAIALLLSLIGGDGWINLIYSLIIGNLSSLFINGGRWGVSMWLLHGKKHTPQAELINGWPGWRWVIPLVVVGSLLGYALGSWLAAELTDHVGDMPTGQSWQGWLAILLISTGASLGVTWLFFTRASMAASQAAAEAAARTAAQTQLRLLQSQLEPHMLFNTLANLRALIGVDAERAQQMLDQLIDFLRATLSASQASLHPLQAEFDRVADYLALMQVRMGSRLSVTLDLPPELATQPVPPLLLQPLVENAIKHGLEPQRRGGHIGLSARIVNDQLYLCVEDTGQGLGRGSSTTDGGFGTTLVRERLQTLYGDQAHFELQRVHTTEGHPHEARTRATVTLPLESPGPAHAMTP